MFNACLACLLTLEPRFLSCRAASKKVTVTLKPSLVGSKLRTMASFKDAMVGVRSHGVVTGAEDRGVFVSFFGGLSGTAGHADAPRDRRPERPGCAEPLRA